MFVLLTSEVLKNLIGLGSKIEYNQSQVSVYGFEKNLMVFPQFGRIQKNYVFCRPKSTAVAEDFRPTATVAEV